MKDTINLEDKLTAFEKESRVEFRDEILYKIYVPQW